MPRTTCAAAAILLIIASLSNAYPATEGELVKIIQNCEETACNSAFKDCGAACALEKNECTSNCRGAMSACFNQCEIARQGCVAGCGTARSACVEACLGAEGLDGCLHLYDSASPDPFIICAMSHEPGPAPTAIPEPPAPLPTALPPATPVPYETPSLQCGGAKVWNGTDCVLFETPPSPSCILGFLLAGIAGVALFSQSRH